GEGWLQPLPAYAVCANRKAIGYLRRSIALARPTESQLPKAYSLLISCHDRDGQTYLTWEACNKALGLFPDDVELRFRKGMLLHKCGRVQEAANTYLDILNNPGERRLSSVERGLRGFKTRHNLAVVYSDMQDWPR